MKKAIITGVNGQDGSYLAEHLISKNYMVYGLMRRSSSNTFSRIIQLINNSKTNKKFKIIYSDLLDFSSIHNLVSNINPDEIYNLAAQSDVGISFEIPVHTNEVNYIGFLNLLESVRNLKTNKQIKIYQASSSEIFGNSLNNPQNELSDINPASPYAISKYASYLIGNHYRDIYKMFISNGILFNHESPRRGENFVTKKVTKSVANIFKGKQNFLFVGNLYSKRDWGHARDYVKAMHKILLQKKPDDFVISTGYSYSVKQLIETAFKSIKINISWKGKGLKEVGFNKKTNKILVKIKKEFYRPLDVNHLLGDSSKAKKILNWKNKASFEELIHEMVQFDIKES